MIRHHTWNVVHLEKFFYIPAVLDMYSADFKDLAGVEVIIGTPIFGCLVLPLFVVALVLRNERLKCKETMIGMLKADDD